MSTGHGEKRSRKEEKFIAALLSQPTVEAAATATGISISTSTRWLQDPEFQRKYQTARRETLRRTMGRLQTAASEAVDALREIQSNGQSESARVSAARTILEQSIKAADIEDIQQRLDLLEQAIKSKQ